MRNRALPLNVEIIDDRSKSSILMVINVGHAVASYKVDDRLAIVMPTIITGLQLLPRSFQ